MPWKVILTKTPVQNDFRSNFFPRLLWYKKEAQELVNEVKQKGGDARIEKVSRKEKK